MFLRHVRHPFYAPPDGDGGGGGDLTIEQAKSRIEYLEREAKDAFKTRDAKAKELKDLKESGRLLTDEDVAEFTRLRDAAAKADEDAKKKAGEWDKLREQLVTKHTGELTTRDETIATLSRRFKDTVVRAAFGQESDLFGGATAKTVLDVQMAIDVLGKYVAVEDTTDHPAGYRLVVKDVDGQIILGQDGKPAPFGAAITDLINALPNKDRILRGSGKAGSGSSGGAGGGRTEEFDLRKLTPDQLRDPEVLKKIQALTGRSGVVMGEAYSR